MSEAGVGGTTNQDHRTPRRFQVLSLDGGGIRGVFAAAILAAIEEDLGTSVLGHFDLVAGTSTGGIIALALGLGVSPREILSFYIEYGPRIFRTQFGLASLRHWFLHKHSGYALEVAMKTIFGDRRFGDSKCRLVIPSYNLDEGAVYIFRTPHLERLRRDYRVPAWKVAMATGAAPTYFPVFRGVDNLRLVDGGVWANNPSMVAIAETIGGRSLNIPRSQVALLSIGTLCAVHAYKRRLNWAGRLGWASSAPEVLLEATSVGVGNQVRYLLGDDRYLRLNPNVPDNDLALDDVAEVETFIARARHHSREFMPTIQSRFLAHVAAPYEPLYGL